jgi:endonuclease YncB( thermonuclease family)
MPYRLIKGEFALHYQGQRHVGSKPDGDSVWFRPNRPQLLSHLGGRDAELNGGGFAQLRFEGIDALELHYPGSYHQHKQATVAARDFMLGQLGFPPDQIVYAPNQKIPSYVRACAPPSVRGHILSRNVDPFGRPVAFVFTDPTNEADGANVFLDVDDMNASINAMLMGQGHVYPGYYGARDDLGGLPWDLRDRLTELADGAWQANRGVWAVDKSQSNPLIRNMVDLTKLAIWPKLYRRLAKYFLAGNNALAGLDGWLRAEPDERDDDVWIIPLAEEGNLHDLFKVTNNHINMLYWPEDIIIIPR